MDQEHRELGDREDEDRVEEELEGGDGLGGEVVEGGGSCRRASIGMIGALTLGVVTRHSSGSPKTWYNSLRIARKAQDAR